MEENDWYESVEKDIGSLKDKMNSSDNKLYELDLLLRVAKRVVGLSSDCEYCQGHRNDISSLVTDLGNLPKMTEQEAVDYGRTFRSILKHLEKHHGFRSRGSSIALVLLVIGGSISIIMGIISLSPGDMEDFSGGMIVVFIGIILMIISTIWYYLSRRKPI